MKSLDPNLDHLVYAVHDLESAVSDLEEKLGVRAAPGGKHPSGTHNALIAVGPSSYLEVIAPDPEANPSRQRTFGPSRLVTWAVRSSALEDQISRARERGYDPGNITPGQRKTPDGETLSWRTAFPANAPANPVVPFLIDWMESRHPASTSPAGPPLVRLVGYHPNPGAVENMLAALGVVLELDRAEVPALVATLQGHRGEVIID